MPSFRHATAEYDCSFCKIASGGSSKNTTQNDVLFRGAHVTAFMASKNWPNNKWHVLIIPNEH